MKGELGKEGGATERQEPSWKGKCRTGRVGKEGGATERQETGMWTKET